MKKYISSIVLTSFLLNLFNFNIAFAGINISTFDISGVGSSSYSFDIWQEFKFNIRSSNTLWEALEDVYVNIDFWNTGISYTELPIKWQQNKIDGIPTWSCTTSDFDWEKLRCEVTTSSVTQITDGQTFSSQPKPLNWFKVLGIASNYQNNLKVWFEWTTESWDPFETPSINKTIYLNVKPHIIDYSFSSSNIKTWWNDTQTLELKVKDANWCSNIDSSSASVKADLSQITGYSSSEDLSFISCDSVMNIATYQKDIITNDASWTNYSFNENNFLAIDADGNQNNPNDSRFPDWKTGSINLTVTEDTTPVVTIVDSGDFIIGWPDKETDNITFSANRTWNYKVSVWDYSSCTSWVVLDSTAYSQDQNEVVTISASDLIEWSNKIYVCVENTSTSELWSSYFTKKLDTVSPDVENITISPSSIAQDESSTLSFECSENWTYSVKVWGNNVWNWNIDFWVKKSITIDWASMSLWSNSVEITCEDEASNKAVETKNITVVQAVPDMWNITYFADEDILNNWLDGRDMTFEWSITQDMIDYSNFESYRVFLFPTSDDAASKVTLSNQIALFTDKTKTEATLWESITEDSNWDILQDEWVYQLCIWILWTNWKLGQLSCQSGVKLSSDEIVNSNIESAKIIDSNKLELITDINIAEKSSSYHNVNNITFKIGSNVYVWTSIDSVVNNKVVILFSPSLNTGNTEATWTDLTAINALWSAVWDGWYNNQLNDNSILVEDWQDPEISNFWIVWTNENGFYTWDLEVTYTNSEEFSLGNDTKIEFKNAWGNAILTVNHNITNSTYLEEWTHTINLDTENLWLISGGIYEVRIYWKDINWNTSITDTYFTVKIDNEWPDQVELNTQEWTTNPNITLSWTTPTDNNWNWVWVRDYTFEIFKNTDCTETAYLQETLTSTSKSLVLPENSDYSWRVKARDNLLNFWEYSVCQTFKYDDTVANISDFTLTNITTWNNSYVSGWDSLKLSAKLDNAWTIQTDLSWITGNQSHNALWCVDIDGIICTQSGSTIEYTLTAANWINKASTVSMYVETVVWLSNDKKSINFTFDSDSPTIWNFTSPVLSQTYGGDEMLIELDSQISDKNFEKIKLEYSENWWTDYNLISDNLWATGPYTWSLSWVNTGTNYKIRITATDKAWNESIKESDVFSIDTTWPQIDTWNINLSVDKNIVAGWQELNISWVDTAITGTLSSSPITFEYTQDGTNYINIPWEQTNDWTYIWTPASLINTENAKIKLIVTDIFGNTVEEILGTSFIIDSTIPSLEFGNATPSVGWYVNDSFELNWTVSDKYLEKVIYTFQNLDNWKYFDWSTWQDTLVQNDYCIDTGVLESDNNCNNLSKLDINSAIINWNSYKLALMASDKAWNQKEIYRNYNWDISAPVLDINYSDWDKLNENLILTWSTTDNLSWVSWVKIAIEKDWEYWNGTEFQIDKILLNTTTTNNYATWDYSFQAPVDSIDWDLFVIEVNAYDKAYKINNSTQSILNLTLDNTWPNIESDLFTNPVGWELLAGWTWETLNITWDSSKITDTNAWLKTNSVKLSYLNAWEWIEIASWLENNWSYTWNIPTLDVSTKIQLEISDNTNNSSTATTNSFLVDSTAPVIENVLTKSDWNGQIDWLIVEFSEWINNANSLDITNIFSVSDWIILDGTYLNTETNWKTILELNFDSAHWDTSSTPTLSWNGDVIEDLSGKKLSSWSIISTDNSQPRIINSNIYDEDNNWKFDKIILNFSENILWLNMSDFSLNNALSGMSISSASIDDNNLTINLVEWDNYITEVWSLWLNFINGWTVVDNNWNTAVSNNNIVLNDLAGIVIYKAEYLDTDSNNKVDQILWYLSETATGFTVNDFSLTGKTINSGSLDSNKITLNIDETTSDNETNIVDLNLDYTAWTLVDLYWNSSPNMSILVSDLTSPTIVSREVYDEDWNWKLDLLQIELSEDISWDFNSFDFVVDWYNVESYDQNCWGNNVICVNIEERDIIETNLTPETRLSVNNSITDANWNILWTESALNSTTADKMWAIILNARYEDWATTADDVLNITFSEDVDLSWAGISDFVISSIWSFWDNSQIISTSQNSVSIQMWDWATKLVPWITEISLNSWIIPDLNGNTTSVNNVKVVLSWNIIVNEVMYSSNDSYNNQYIELKNLSNADINLSGYKLQNVLWNGTDLDLSGTITAWGYYLISKTWNSIFSWITPNLTANLLLGPNGQTQIIKLVDTNWVTLDRVQSLPWAAWSNSLVKSMERKEVSWDGYLSSSWYTAWGSVGFVNTTPKWTPWTENVFDSEAPEITSFFPTDSKLLPTWNFPIDLKYEDNSGWLWVSSTSADIKLYKYSSWTWGSDISSTYINNEIVDANQAKYYVEWLDYWKYKAEFTVSDLAGNNVVKNIEFYVDDFSFEISDAELNIWELSPIINNYSQELTVTVKTIWAGFKLNMTKNELLSNGSVSIVDFDWTNWYWYELYDNWYDWVIDSIWNEVEIWNISENINTSWDLNTYTFKLRYWVKLPDDQVAWIYQVNNWFNVTLDY